METNHFRKVIVTNHRLDGKYFGCSLGFKKLTKKIKAIAYDGTGGGSCFHLTHLPEFVYKSLRFLIEGKSSFNHQDLLFVKTKVFVLHIPHLLTDDNSANNKYD